MARKKSVTGSILSATVFTAIAASVGYLTYRRISSATSKRSSARPSKPSKPSVKSKGGKKRSKGSISRRKDSSGQKGQGSSGGSPKKTGPAVRWIPNLRVREQKILNAMPQGKEISMSDIARKFSDVTVRTLRRDMDSLAEKGRVTRSGTTRATTYRKV